MRRLFGLVAATAAFSAHAACGTQLPEEPAILDVRPSKLQLGDTLIVEGAPVRATTPGATSLRRDTPTFRASVDTRVILEGTFGAEEDTDPAAPVLDNPGIRRVELPATAVPARANAEWAERVLLPVDDYVAQKVGRAHFVGRVGVTQKDKSPGSEATFWLGTVEAPVRLSFFQPSMRNLADQIVAWISDGRMLGWLGLQVEATGQSLQVVGLEPGDRSGSSLASSAGLQVGDKIERAAGKPVKSAADLTLAFRQTSRRGKVALGVKRGDRELSVDIAPRDKPFIVPSSVIDLAVMVIFGLVALTVALVISGTLTWFERRVAGRMQSRVGPNRVGPFGFLQWVADGVKLLLKEDIIPDAVDRPLFKLAPYLVFMGLLGTFVVLPFGQYLIIADLNVGLIYLIAITGFVSLGLMMAGWSSNNKWALLGGMRSAAQIISYEIPTGLALMVPVVLAGTLSTQTLVERQGGLPWQWNVFDNPFIFGCFIIYFVSALAEGNRTPFDLPEAESELVAGYNIEYSGWRFAVFFLSEWANLFVVGAVATTVFLGGWRVPWVTLAEQASHWYLQLFGLFLFFAKAMTLVFVIIWIRWTLPRFRVDQMMGLCWKYFVPWTFAALIFQAFWVWVAPPAARSVVHAFTFVICGLGLLVLFFSRVYYNWRMNPEEFSWKQLY